MIKNPPAKQEVWFDPRSGRSSGEDHGKSTQYSCLGNPMDRGAWWATVHGLGRVGHNVVTKQQQQQNK